MIRFMISGTWYYLDVGTKDPAAVFKELLKDVDQYGFCPPMKIADGQLHFRPDWVGGFEVLK